MDQIFAVKIFIEEYLRKSKKFYASSMNLEKT